MSHSIRQLLISQSLANLADVFFRIVIIANIFTLSGSVIATSMVPILIGCSSFLASFFVPLVTRKYALNKVLFYTQCGKTLLLAILFLWLGLSKLLPIAVLYAFVLSISVLDGFAAPVSYAIIPRYANDLGKANAALSMSSESIQLVGWGLGGLLFASLGFYPSILIIFILFLLSSLFMFFLPLVETHELDSETSFETLIKGWRMVVKQPTLRFLIQANLLEILANTIWVSSVILIFVTNLLHQTESYWGYVNTAYSIGILLGGALVFRLSDFLLKRKWQSMAFPLLFMAVLTTVILLAPNATSFLILSLLIGLLSQIKEVPESVLLQESVPENELIHIYSVFEVLSTLAFSGFVLFMSILTESFGVSASFWIAIMCLVFEAILVFRYQAVIDSPK